MATKRTREDDDEMEVEQPQAKKQNNTDTELEELYEMIGKLLILDESEIKYEPEPEDELEEESQEEEYGPLEHCMFCENYVENSLFTCNFCIGYATR
jgi:hypothetical protein